MDPNMMTGDDIKRLANYYDSMARLATEMDRLLATGEADRNPASLRLLAEKFVNATI